MGVLERVRTSRWIRLGALGAVLTLCCLGLAREWPVVLPMLHRLRWYSVPASAVADRAGAKVVFALEGDRVRMVPVTLGPPFAGGFELVSGPEPGSKVVSDPPPTARIPSAPVPVDAGVIIIFPPNSLPGVKSSSLRSTDLLWHETPTGASDDFELGDQSSTTSGFEDAAAPTPIGK